MTLQGAQRLLSLIPPVWTSADPIRIALAKIGDGRSPSLIGPINPEEASHLMKDAMEFLRKTLQLECILQQTRHPQALDPPDYEALLKEFLSILT